MRTRAQISLDTELLARAKQRAGTLGISLAEYVGRLLDRDLGPADRVAEPRTIFGLGRSDGRDVGTDCDAMLGEAVEAGRRGGD